MHRYAVVAVGTMLAAIASTAIAPAPAQRPAAAAAPLNTVRVDLAQSLGAFPAAPGRALSAIPKSPLNHDYGPATYANLERLGLRQARVWVNFTDAYDVATRTPAYERLHRYLDAYHARAGTLLVNWQTAYSPLVTGEPSARRSCWPCGGTCSPTTSGATRTSSTSRPPSSPPSGPSSTPC